VTSKDIIYANRYIKFASKYLIFASKDMPLDDPNIEPGNSKMLQISDLPSPIARTYAGGIASSRQA